MTTNAGIRKADRKKDAFDETAVLFLAGKLTGYFQSKGRLYFVRFLWIPYFLYTHHSKAK
jgi:hypothetical protein